MIEAYDVLMVQFAKNIDLVRQLVNIKKNYVFN